jgi:ABC-type branched-subunit amino acid transport system ATPase component
MSEPLLSIADLRAGYGSAVVLDDISLELAAQGGIALLGRKVSANPLCCSPSWVIRG